MTGARTVSRMSVPGRGAPGPVTRTSRGGWPVTADGTTRRTASWPKKRGRRPGPRSRRRAVTAVRWAHLELLGADQHHGRRVRPRPAGADLILQHQAAEGRAGHVSLDAAGQQVGLAHEAGQVGVERRAVQILGPGIGDDAAVSQHGHPVGHRQRLVLVVGDEHGRGAPAAQDLGHLLGARWPAGRRRGTRTARRAGRPRVRWPGPGPGPPAAAGRPRAGADSGARARSGRRRRAGRRPSSGRLRRQPEADVGGHSQMGEKSAVLGHVADPAPLGRTVRCGRRRTRWSPAAPHPTRSVRSRRSPAAAWSFRSRTRPAPP